MSYLLLQNEIWHITAKVKKLISTRHPNQNEFYDHITLPLSLFGTNGFCVM
jgi:hypothetical protein